MSGAEPCTGSYNPTHAPDGSEHILRQYDVKTARIQDQLHRAVIDQQMIQRHIRILGGDFANHPPP
jgi:hypothetical protein